jgi:death-on-curing family protein
LPTSSEPFRFTPAFIEFLHDEGIALNFPGIEPVYKNDVLDRNLLESAAEQPFQGGFGQDFYPTIYDKAACLFFSIAGGHIFSNGNKRTGVLALDQFLLANSVYLLLSNEDIKQLAKSTASYREREEDHKLVKQRISDIIRAESTEFRTVRELNPTAYRRFLRLRRSIRKFVSEMALAQP